MQNPKVSVVIPCLNSQDYLEECLLSVINQTLQEIEIIVVDGGSTDGTLDIIERFNKTDSRIQLLHSTKKSYGYQLNLGISAATGEFLGIVESDDIILPRMYEHLYSIAKNNQSELVKSDHYIFFGNKENRSLQLRKLISDESFYGRPLNPLHELEVFKAYVLNQPGIYNLAFIRKNNIRLNESPGASYQDNGFWFQIFALASSVYFDKGAFYLLRRDNPNSSVYNRQKVYAMCEEYDFIRRFLGKHKKIEKKLAPVCAYARYGNYRFTLNRIADEYKFEFCKRFSEDFIKIKEQGELSRCLFSNTQWNDLNFIINDPYSYYYLKVFDPNREISTIHELGEQNKLMLIRLERIERFISSGNNRRRNGDIRQLITRFFSYYRTHGMTQTIKKSVQHLFN